MTSPSLFGSRRRTEVLLLITLLEESHPREIASALQAPLRSVQNIVNDLDESGIVASRYIGRERRVSLNPRLFGAQELKELLQKLALKDTAVNEAAESLRRRPRKAGKAV